MEIDVLRSLVTVLSFASFIGIVLWAYSGRRRRQFEEAAALPFADEGDGSAPGPAAVPSPPIDAPTITPSRSTR